MSKSLEEQEKEFWEWAEKSDTFLGRRLRFQKSLDGFVDAMANDKHIKKLLNFTLSALNKLGGQK